MSANPLFSNKKRDNSALYGTGRLHSNLPPFPPQGHPSNDRNGYPPPKRSRTAPVPESKAMADPFCDNEDFTADDLEEIDILASQAYTPDGGVADVQLNHIQSKELTKKHTTSVGNTSTLQTGPLRQRRNVLDAIEDKDALGIGVLQAEYEDLKRKLKELEDQILIKNGEIKVLRDALRQSDSNLEQQKMSQLLQEKEKAQIHSEKEKELLKKMQSLKSELEFKDAEMNELKTKIQNTERNRISITSLSPKKSPPRATKAESFYSPQMGRSNFPTKESFSADMNFKPAKSENEISQNKVGQIKSLSCSYRILTKNNQGSGLLNALMQQPLYPGSLGLYHLLSNNLDVPVGSLKHSKTPGTSGSSVLSPTRCSTLNEAQRLAVTGLNAIAVGEDYAFKREGQNSTGFLHLNKMSPLPGAVHLLPLVKYHITAYCQALRTIEKSGGGPSETQSKASSVERNFASGAEDVLSTVIEPAVTSLEILYHLVCYSIAVVRTLLQSTKPQEGPPSEAEQEPDGLNHSMLESPEHGPHSLFKILTFLLCTTTVTCQRHVVRNQILKVFVKLAENSPKDLLYRFHSLFRSSAFHQCLAPESPAAVVLMTVRLLALLSDQEKLSALLCSCSETCLLHTIYTYVVSRPDNTASESLWLQLEHEVVRFLTKLYSQGWSPLTTESGVTCQCNREVVRALVLTLHKEWLCVRCSALLAPTSAHSKAVQFLRETVLLLHSLSQKDKNFSEHCLEVLHQYDQAVSGVRTIFKKFNFLKEIEEFALDELCPPEIETEEEYMDCT
ncbi:ATR-interacting protein [Spea bombifrons]|uniref:ATR-interacting protein n=1 Tax=Spea bombifrons TaxID=233779 RepID=UPI0023499469|nr:ATR-interacting protein [Spea bombifrons]